MTDSDNPVVRQILATLIPFYRNYLPSVLRLKDANIGSVVFKKAKVFNSIKVSHRVPADTAITAP